ncbi:uncharacterized protein N7500_009329 [Penicillium coprophilum]|uniref:uncharacterized protein n=1 Tax=Penicillium coprophilum TaxID=36646 RepID=UPI002398BB4C|nr:uncharacterized protein N7500_009329 [Penicillium coprophilum]KAJ5153890.1 hypothetical protein N7500_009329 [Penicillium coprophilum]
MPSEALSLAAVGWSIAGTGIIITAGLNYKGILLQLKANKKDNLSEAEEGRATGVMRFIPEITNVQMRVDDLMQWAKRRNLQLSPIDQEYARLAGSYEGFKTL